MLTHVLDLGEPGAVVARHPNGFAFGRAAHRLPLLVEGGVAGRVSRTDSRGLRSAWRWVMKRPSTALRYIGGADFVVFGMGIPFRNASWCKTSHLPFKIHMRVRSLKGSELSAKAGASKPPGLGPGWLFLRPAPPQHNLSNEGVFCVGGTTISARTPTKGKRQAALGKTLVFCPVFRFLNLRLC